MFFSSAVVTSRVLFPLCLVALTAMQAEPTQLSSSSVRDRVRAYELSCVATLQAITVANGPYWGGDPAKGYASSLRELGPRGAGILDSVAASGKKDGYHFRLLPERTTDNQAIRHYTIEAWPIKRLVKNQRSFVTDETGVIRFTTENRTAKNTDPLLDVPSPRIGNKKTSEMMRTELKWLDLNTTGTAVGVYGVFRGLSAAR